MFEKVKARAKQAVKNEVVQDVKTHFHKYQAAYSCGAVAVVTAGITALILREHVAEGLGSTAPEGLGSTGGFGRVQTRAFSFALFQKDSGNAVTTIHNGSRGNPGFITRNLETGRVTATQTKMAEEFGIPRSLLSDHLNGKLPDVDGYHFERIAVA